MPLPFNDSRPTNLETPPSLLILKMAYPEPPTFKNSGKGTLNLDVIVVGAGFGGLYQLYRLRELVYNVKLVDIAIDLGG
ncbi:hypothetical protein B7494_g7618 [Chlorociboria aeruginascens]|nr:hypothetical protein B7494_g7618 [Chlorociboria aeruginascens]